MTAELEVEFQEDSQEMDLEFTETSGNQGGAPGSLLWTAASAPIYDLSAAAYTTPISNLSGRDLATPNAGDLVFYGAAYYPVTAVSSTTVTMSAPVSIQGPEGAAGQDGAPGAAGADGEDGTTFTPSVSPAGVISWTNDGGKTNPQSVDLVSAVINALSTEVTVSTAGAVTQALDAGKIYHFTGALTALTITLNAASGLAHYHFDFDCGSTAPTVTLPNAVVMPSGNFEANKHYEVDILNNYGAVISWANS